MEDNGFKTFGGSYDENTSYNDQLIVKEKNKPYVYRVVDGPCTQQLIYYPTINNKGEKATAVLTVGNDYKSDYLLWNLAEADTLAKQQAALAAGVSEKELYKYRSNLYPQKTYPTWIIALEDLKAGAPVLRRFNMKKSVRDEVNKLSSESYTNKDGVVDDTHLQYGLKFMLWFKTVKLDDPDKKGDYAIKYDTVVLRNEAMDGSSLTGKIPKTHLIKPGVTWSMKEDGIYVIRNNNYNEAKLSYPWQAFFTAEEWAAVFNCQKSIEEASKPMSIDDQAAKLLIQPLDPYATDKKGNLLLANPEDIAKVAAQLKIPLLPEKSEHTGFGYLPEQAGEEQEQEEQTVNVDVSAESTNVNEFFDSLKENDVKDTEEKSESESKSKKWNFV